MDTIAQTAMEQALQRMFTKGEMIFYWENLPNKVGLRLISAKNNIDQECRQGLVIERQRAIKEQRLPSSRVD